MRVFARAVVLAVVLPVCAGRAAGAQEKVTLRSDLLLYGDNTEFRNPFREGETIFGAAARVFADIELNPRVRVYGRLGRELGYPDAPQPPAAPVEASTAGGPGL
jgi:hypothetical protein